MTNKHNKHYQKHLTLLNREDIEKLLKAGLNFIKLLIIFKKILLQFLKKYRTEHFPSNFNNRNNYCKNKNSCTIKNLCNSNCHSECRHCAKCNSICSQYELDLCAKLLKPPYVCNACNCYQQCRKLNMYILQVKLRKNMKAYWFLVGKELILQKMFKKTR